MPTSIFSSTHFKMPVAHCWNVSTSAAKGLRLFFFSRVRSLVKGWLWMIGWFGTCFALRSLKGFNGLFNGISWDFTGISMGFKHQSYGIIADRWRISGCWFGTCLIFPEILGMSSSQLTNSYFSEGLVYHQPDFCCIFARASQGMVTWYLGRL